MRTRTSRLLAGGVVGASLLLSGCFSVDYELTIGDDGTMDVAFEARIDTTRFEEFGALFGEAAGFGPDELFEEAFQGEDPCAELEATLGDYDVDSEEIRSGSEIGVRCSVKGVAFDDFDPGADGPTVRITQDSQGTTFRGEFSGVSALTGETAEATELLDLDFDELVQIRMVVTGPGGLIDDNATSTSGRTATWVITPDADFIEGDVAIMEAEWGPPGSGGGGSSNTLWIILGDRKSVV